MNQMTVARYFTQQIALSGKNQKQIAEECGYVNPNIITMFKKGKTKVPLDRAPAIARALEVDPRHFLLLVLKEYQPEVWEVMSKTLGHEAIVTEDELKILRLVRTVGQGRRPNLAIAENHRVLTSAIRETVERDNRMSEAAVARLEAMPKNMR